MSDQMCKTCRFWLPQEESVSGLCRRFPPTASEAGAWFPAMKDFGWCGEWKRKTQ